MPKTARVDVTWTVSARLSADEVEAVELLIAAALSGRGSFLRSPSALEVTRRSDPELSDDPPAESVCAATLLAMFSDVRVFLDRWIARFPGGDGKPNGYRKIRRLVQHYGLTYVGDLLLLTDEQLNALKNIGVETIKKVPIVLHGMRLSRGRCRTLEAFASLRRLQTAAKD